MLPNELASAACKAADQRYLHAGRWRFWIRWCGMLSARRGKPSFYTNLLDLEKMIAVFAFMFSSIINLPQAMHASSSSVRGGQQHVSSMETRGM
jgi:hypothetical protein